MRGTRWVRLGALLATVAASGAIASPASASVSSVLGGDTWSGTAIPCTTQSDGVQVCHGTDESLTAGDLRLKSVTGSVSTPLEIYVILPPGASSGAKLPLIVQSHGYGSAAQGPGTDGGTDEYFGPTADTWAHEGYAVVQLTARGFGDSCGKLKPPTISYDLAACGTTGYIRLDDDRYEARDVQNAVGDLVDGGLVDPGKIGVTGESYGGGISLQLATLKDRVMNQDGSLSQWKSPAGTPLSIAAAAPMIPWSDLAYSLVPNGHTYDVGVIGKNDDASPLGIEKQSFVSGLYAEGQSSGNYAVAGTDSQADLTTWYSELNSPTFESDPNAPTILDTIQHYHSAYYLLDGKYGYPAEAPAPLLIANGFTDDLFPVDEALRYRNLEASLFPTDPAYLFDWDGGHERGQNKAADLARLSSYVQSFFDRYLKGSGTQLPNYTALTQTCPATAPSGGPYTASSWAGLHPGLITYTSATPQTVSSGGSATVAQAFDPISGPGACATAAATDQGSGVASYRLPAATGSGYTLLGSATVYTELKNATNTQISARLLDVDPTANTETLVARGVYRATADGFTVFQLHPGAWHFAAGHIAKLELLSSDTPYTKAPDGSESITVSALGLGLPVRETPGSSSVITKPGPITAPQLAPCTFTASVKLKAKADNIHGIVLKGTSAEINKCAHLTTTQRRYARISRVLVAIDRGVGHGKCEFVAASGKLSHPRRCGNTLFLKAGGTGKWQWRVHLRKHLPKGRYNVEVDAEDGYHHYVPHKSIVHTSLRLP